jgi:uncharacterized protein YcfJ
MHKTLLSLGLALAILAPSLIVSAPAMADVSRCERAKHDRKVEGTVVGGALGAVAGTLIAPKHNKLLGAALGGAAGAAVGNNMARSKERCPDGYARRHYDERYYDVKHSRYRHGDDERRCRWEDRKGDQWQVCN